MKKHIRMQNIIETLDRWGKLSKPDISKRVLSRAGEQSTPSFERALYRDLESLVNDSKIHVEYFTRDGGLIEDYDPAIHKNVECKWFTFGAENKASGSKILNELNGSIYCPKILSDEILLTEGRTDPYFKTKHFYFTISGKHLVLKVSLDSIPVNILVSRKNEKISKSEVDEVTKVYGQRTILFKVPFPKVSSYNTQDERLGHLLISINQEGTTIRDLESSNGTKFIEINRAVSDEIRLNNNLLSTSTASLSWIEVVSANELKFIELEKEKLINDDVVISLADDFLLLVI